MTSSYGYLKINDGIMPDSSQTSDPFTSFSVGLECSQNTVSLSGVVSGSGVQFSKTIHRIAPNKNPIGNAKLFVSHYAGCGEASMLRNRILAMSRIRISVSEEEFRFRLPE